MPYEQAPKEKFEVTLAGSLFGAKRMRREGKEPIVVRGDEDEILVFVKSEEAIARMREIGGWVSGDDKPEGDGYVEFVYAGRKKSDVIELLENS